MNNEFLSPGDLLLSRDALLHDHDGGALRRGAQGGRLVRLRRGAYVDAASWMAASSLTKYRHRIRAVVATRENPCVVSHQSAGALWGFPRIGQWPRDVHVIPMAVGGHHSRNGIAYHRETVTSEDCVELGGLVVTSQLRTLVDLARTDSFAEAVAAIDHAMNPKTSHPHPAVTQAELWRQLGKTVSTRGVAKAFRAISFACAQAGSPGESLSRVMIDCLGFVAPQLQTPHVNPRGGRFFTDFEWPDVAIIGEFDGRSKYSNAECLDGLAPADVVIEEKIREDSLRSEGNTVVRWVWDDVRNPSGFSQILTKAHVPRRSRSRVRSESATFAPDRHV